MITLTRSALATSIGTVEVEASERGVRSIRFLDTKDAIALPEANNVQLQECMQQLAAYFAGERRVFDSFALAIAATDFQQRVWDAAMEVAYGETATYGDIAKSIGAPDAARAVGSALNRNPLLLVVPCHRIVPASGGNGEFACGAWRKDWLLNFESAKG
jgi:methylated-DNA-[protein]-cysteine S-methyltransferase